MYKSALVRTNIQCLRDTSRLRQIILFSLPLPQKYWKNLNINVLKQFIKTKIYMYIYIYVSINR